MPSCSHSPFRAIWYDFHRLHWNMSPAVGRSVVGPRARIAAGVHLPLLVIVWFFSLLVITSVLAEPERRIDCH
jgi:hypothetical protein